EKYYSASQFQLAWGKFQRHRLAMVAGFVLALLYLMAFFADFLAPYGPNERFADFTNAPPQVVRFIDAEGRLQLNPFVYAVERPTGRERLFKAFTENVEKPLPIRFFVEGNPYKFLGFIDTNIHLFGLEA